jgi:hypothetical protein
MVKFGDYSNEKEKWITFVDSPYYPDILESAVLNYEPTEKRFGELLDSATDSANLYMLIIREHQRLRIQLLRVFRKYVSPDTSVEMLKRVGKADDLLDNFGHRFRPLDKVIEKFNSRPVPDIALAAILNEYKDRGQKGYTLTGVFFNWFVDNYGEEFSISGPIGAGKDIDLKQIFDDYPKSRPVDFIIHEIKSSNPIVIGFARYDSDRGGAQEDDRTGGYGNVIKEIDTYFENKEIDIKIVFLNDGPGLTLGSMWRDYASLEEMSDGDVMVLTLKMLGTRLTREWLNDR